MSKNERGFTLMELLVAMVITVLLVAALFNVFNLAGRAWQKGEARTQRYQNLRQALDRMSEEIRGAILLNSAANPGKDIRFYGQDGIEGSYGDRLSFISVSHPPAGWDYGSDYGVSPPELRFDCCELSYYVTLSEGETKLIRRLQTTNVPDTDVDAKGDGSANALAEHITKLDFTYYNAAGTASDAWNSSTNLPTRVRIELTAKSSLAREQREETFTTEVWLGNANFQ